MFGAGRWSAVEPQLQEGLLSLAVLDNRMCSLAQLNVCPGALALLFPKLA